MAIMASKTLPQRSMASCSSSLHSFLHILSSAPSAITPFHIFKKDKPILSARMEGSPFVHRNKSHEMLNQNCHFVERSFVFPFLKTGNEKDTRGCRFVSASLAHGRDVEMDGESHVDEAGYKEQVLEGIKGAGMEEWKNADMALWPEKLRLPGGLYLVGTPIGNLEDITLRALRVLRRADLVLAEDTRHSAKLLRFYGIKTPMMSYHQFNATSRRDSLVLRLQRGEVLALISDAGMPAISDPGADLVRACVEGGAPVVPIPGPSAVTSAIAASAMPSNDFTFLGFPPEKASVRQKRLALASRGEAASVIFAGPHKLRVLLREMQDAFGGDRRCVLAREMTKMHEEFWRGTLDGAVEEFEKRSPKGEVTIVVEGLGRREAEEKEKPGEDEVEDRLLSFLQAGASPSEASRLVVEELSVRRKVVYPIALRLWGNLNDDANLELDDDPSNKQM